MKTCHKCRKSKSPSRFSYNRRAKDQRCVYCKQCHKKAYKIKKRLAISKGYPRRNYLIRNQTRADIEQTRAKKFCGECFNNAGGYCKKLFQRYMENSKGTLGGLQIIKAKKDFREFNYCLDFV